MAALQVRIILEILGRPSDYVTESLGLLLEKLAAEKGIKVVEKKIHEPTPVKDAKDLFTAFAEITLDIESIDIYLYILFNYMPSNIEVISPDEVQLRNEELSVLGSQLVQRLHGYDSIAKKLLFEKDMLLKKLQEVAPHLLKSNNNSQTNEQITTPLSESKQKNESKISSPSIKKLKKLKKKK